jgi:hypothetical protein
VDENLFASCGIDDETEAFGFIKKFDSSFVHGKKN